MNIILKGQLGYLNQFFEIIGLSSFDEKHSNEIIQREGIRLNHIEMKRDISIVKDVKALLKMVLFFVKERPSIVHTHTPKAGFLGMIAAWLAGVPIRIHTVGGLPLIEARGARRFLLKIIERITCQFAQSVYPNSKGLECILSAEGLVSPSKLKVLCNGSSNGVDSAFFDRSKIQVSIQTALRKRLNISDDEFVFVFVGRFAQEKGISELVESFNRISTDRSVKLLLIGAFEKEYGRLNSSVTRALEANRNIIKPGRFDDIRPYLAISDAFVLPTYREGFPNALLEACSMSLPCIATNINGCNEIIKDEIDGLLIEPKSSKALGLAMTRLINNPTEAKEFGRRARETVLRRFQRKLIWEAWRTEYNFHLSQSVENS